MATEEADGRGTSHVEERGEAEDDLDSAEPSGGQRVRVAIPGPELRCDLTPADEA